MKTPYEQTAEFHATFHPVTVSEPTAFTREEASYRAGFKAEELVEFLYAASQNDPAIFQEMITQFKADIDKAVAKTVEKNQPVDNALVAQSDALIDLLYFTYGSFVLMKVDPTEMFDLVHQANMGKLFPDGKVHYHEVTGKVLKPDNWEKDFAPEPKLLAEIQRQKNKSQQGT